MIEKWFYFSCGCTYHQDDVKQINKLKLPDGRLYTGKRCPIHKYGIKQQRITKCVDCGKEIYDSGTDGSPAIRCKEHRAIQEQKVKDSEKKNRNARIKKRRKTPRLDATYLKKQMVRGEYCKDISNCIDEKQFPACLDCDKFYPVFENVDPGRRGAWKL